MNPLMLKFVRSYGARAAISMIGRTSKPFSAGAEISSVAPIENSTYSARLC